MKTFWAKGGQKRATVKNLTGEINRIKSEIDRLEREVSKKDDGFNNLAERGRQGLLSHYHGTLQKFMTIRASLFKKKGS